VQRPHLVGGILPIEQPAHRGRRVAQRQLRQARAQARQIEQQRGGDHRLVGGQQGQRIERVGQHRPRQPRLGVGPGLPPGAQQRLPQRIGKGAAGRAVQQGIQAGEGRTVHSG